MRKALIAGRIVFLRNATGEIDEVEVNEAFTIQVAPGASVVRA